VDIDRGQLIGRRLEDVAVVVDLDEFAPFGGRAAGGRDGRRLERFAEMREDFPDRPTRAMSFAQAIREVSCGRGFS